ncbi:methionine--tRNA ligase [Candidatus Dojkabacteria bacterium]|nr:methionine--tRNA ligase [Candidatus Dojkabacteria bacterium]
MNKKIYIGVAWPYVNGDLHVGHLAGYLLPADVQAKYHKLCGDDVLMISGSDCHGTPITVQADKEDKTPAEVVAEYHPKDVALFKQYGLSYNLYTQTTTPNHAEVTQQLFLDLLENNYIEKGTSLQYYSKADDKFLPDRYIEGECPHCHAKEQRSDQCEACGRMLDQGELIDPVSKISKSPVTLKESEQYFLDLSKLSKEIKENLDKNKENLRTWVYAEAIGWIKEGLQKRAITRDLDWGVPIPEEKIPKEKRLSSFKGKRFYVWFDAVIGYLSGSIEWSKRIENNDQSGEIIFQMQKGQATKWEDWWFNNNSRHYYFMGQDNLVFHTILWPGILIGSKRNYTLPNAVVVNKFLNYEGKKFSKSRNWIIDSAEIADNYGVDPVRFYLLRNSPENKQGNFTWTDFEATVNNELSAKFGNFVHRTLTFINSKFEGNIHKGLIPLEVKSKIQNTFENTAALLGNSKQAAALSEIMALVDFANQYFDQSKVWEVVKTESQKAQAILSNCLVLIANLRRLFYPFITNTSQVISKYLMIDEITPKIGKLLWEYSDEFNPTIKIENNISPLFSKIEVSPKVQEIPSNP